MSPTMLYGAADSIKIAMTVVYIAELSRPSTLLIAFESRRSRADMRIVTMMLRLMVMV